MSDDGVDVVQMRKSVVYLVFNDGATMTFTDVDEWVLMSDRTWPFVEVTVGESDNTRFHAISLENVRRLTVEGQW